MITCDIADIDPGAKDLPVVYGTAYMTAPVLTASTLPVAEVTNGGYKIGDKI